MRSRVNIPTTLTVSPDDPHPNQRAGRKSCWFITRRGTKSFQVLTMSFLLLPLLVVIVHFRPYDPMTVESVDWASFWPCLVDPPEGTLAEVYGARGSEQDRDVFVYQKPSNYIPPQPSPPLSVKQYLLGLAGARERCEIFDPRKLGLGGLIKHRWDQKQKTGQFRTTVTGARIRSSQGMKSPWMVELYLNPGRSHKPVSVPAKAVGNVSQPYDIRAFSFLGAPARDVMFWYRTPSARDLQVDEHASEEGSKGGDGAKESWSTAMSCEPVDRATDGHARDLHAVLINPYPIGDLSGVLVPFPFEERPQGLARSLDAMTVGLTFASELLAGARRDDDRSTNLRVGFNSIGAGASIGHLHFQFWRVAGGLDGRVPIERAPTWPPSPTSFDDVELAVIPTNYHPIRSLVLSGRSIPALSKAAAHCVNVLMDRNIPFSLLMNGQHLYIMPRRFANTTFPFASAGFPEAAGFLLVVNDTYWRDPSLLNADIVWDLWRESFDVGEEMFNGILSACANA